MGGDNTIANFARQKIHRDFELSQSRVGPSRGRRRGRALVLILFLCLFVGVGMLVLYTSDDGYLRFVVAVLVVSSVSAFCWLATLVNARFSNTLRISPHSPLRFVPARRLLVFSLVASSTLILAGLSMLLTWVVPGLNPLTGPPRRAGGLLSGVVLLCAGAFFLIYSVMRLRVPQGLIVSPTGIHWWRGLSEQTMRWEHLSSVDVRGAGGTIQLRIEAEPGSPISFAASLIGSDPRVVAAIARFFWAHPEERSFLTCPETALARVLENSPDRSV